MVQSTFFCLSFFGQQIRRSEQLKKLFSRNGRVLFSSSHKQWEVLKFFSFRVRHDGVTCAIMVRDIVHDYGSLTVNKVIHAVCVSRITIDNYSLPQIDCPTKIDCSLHSFRNIALALLLRRVRETYCPIHSFFAVMLLVDDPSAVQRLSRHVALLIIITNVSEAMPTHHRCGLLSKSFGSRNKNT